MISDEFPKFDLPVKNGPLKDVQLITKSGSSNSPDVRLKLGLYFSSHFDFFRQNSIGIANFYVRYITLPYLRGEQSVKQAAQR